MKLQIKPKHILSAFCFVAGVGVDSMLSGVASSVLPKTYGLPGLVQKVCIKAGTIGLSLVAGDAIENAVKKYAKELADSFDEELKQAA